MSSNAFPIQSSNSIPNESPHHRRWVRESRYGRWFLTTNTWERYVIKDAMEGFLTLLGGQVPKGGQVLDIACGPGVALPFLEQAFEPERIIAADIDREVLETSATENAKRCGCPVELHHETAYALPYADNSFDVVFSHQLLHHSADQAAVLTELKRVMKPDGILLVGESCKVFIHWWWVRTFFRHPMEVQKTGKEYLQLVRDAGLNVPDEQVRMSSPWWSRRDIGISEWLGLPQRKNPEPTEILLIARKA